MAQGSWPAVSSPGARPCRPATGAGVSTGLEEEVVRRVAWEQTRLVEGTEAVLWPAGEVLDEPGPLPSAQEGERAVLSWARPKVLRFETATPRPLGELLLVSTLAVGGPVRFVVRKSYQRGNTAVCEPPGMVLMMERRTLFRVAVSTDVGMGLGEGRRWSVRSLDVSVGGMRVCLPDALEVGQEVALEPVLLNGAVVEALAVVRHCRPYLAQTVEVGSRPPGAFGTRRPSPPTPPSPKSCNYTAGLEFVALTGDAERRLTQFVGHHQRRLMPCVHAVTALEYRSPGRSFVEAFGTDVSPGDLVFKAYEGHVPGEELELRVRLGRQLHHFRTSVLASELVPEEGGAPRRYRVRVSLDVYRGQDEAQFRQAVKELAIERLSAS